MAGDGGGTHYIIAMYIYYSGIYKHNLTLRITKEMLRILATTMRINNFQYEVMSAKRYPLTPYGDIILVIVRKKGYCRLNLNYKL